MRFIHFLIIDHNLNNLLIFSAKIFYLITIKKILSTRQSEYKKALGFERYHNLFSCDRLQ